MTPEPDIQGDRGLGLPAGSRHYRAYVGPPEKYDLVAANQFNLLTTLGLREEHFLLDVGCGSLRAGRLFIPYLLPGRYFGVEPNAWLIEEGIKHEVGESLVAIKKPRFLVDADFSFSAFNQQFDFILAHSIFSHASRQQIRRCLGEAYRVMKPTTVFAATFLEGREDYGGDSWVYPDCCTYTLRGMTDLVEEQGLRCWPIAWPHPNGQTWILILKPEHPGFALPDWT